MTDLEPKAPKPKTITRHTCEGCPCLETKDWSFEGENDDRDSGTDATCAATGRAIGNYWHAHHDTPPWCPALAALPPSPAVVPEGLQQRVAPWMEACFGPEISNDRLERGDRLLEEVLELLQSGDYPKERIAALTDYTYGREKGDPVQEAGGVMITLAAYCLAHGLDMHAAGETELARIWTKIGKIRAKQAAKPTGSALPIASPSPPALDGAGRDAVIEECAKVADGAAAQWRQNSDTLPEGLGGWGPMCAEEIAAAIRSIKETS